MYRTFFTAICLLFLINAGVTAQYSIYKYQYSPKSYQYHYDDRYNPGLCGVASLAVPGLGQIIAGESGRGVAFLCAAAGSYLITYSGALMITNARSVYVSSYETGTYLFIGGLLTSLAVDIWSLVDAVQVAKVNNLAIRDLRKTSLRMQPTIQPGPQGTFSPGLSLTMTF